MELAVSEADPNNMVTVSFTVPSYSDYTKFKLECSKYDSFNGVLYFEQEFADTISGESIYLAYLPYLCSDHEKN